MRLASRWSGIAAALLTVAVGCGDDTSNNNNNNPDLAQARTAQIRVIHGSPDAPAVDVYVKGQTTPAVADAKYGDTSGYLSVPAGQYTFEIRAAGAKPSDPAVYTVGPLDLAPDAKVTALAAGFLNSQSPDEQFRVIPLVESWGPKASGKARVRVVHAGPNAPTVAVDVGNDGTPEIASLARFADTGAAGVELPAGSPIAVGLWAGNPLGRVTAFTTPALPDGGELIVIATGDIARRAREQDGFALLAVGGAGSIGFIKQDPVVYALHASPDTPAVDLFAGSAELHDALEFGRITAPIQVPPGSYTVDIFPSSKGNARPSGSAALSIPTGNLEAGERYLAIATGYLNPPAGKPGLTAIALREAFAADADKARVRAVHASPDAPAVDIGLAAGGKLQGAPIFAGVSFKDVSAIEGFGAPATDLILGVAQAGKTDVAASFGVTTATRQRIIAVAAGALAPRAGIDQSFRLIFVEAHKWPWTATSVMPAK